MTTLASDQSNSRALAVRLPDDPWLVDLADGRSVALPLGWYPRLLPGTPEARANDRLIGEGAVIHGPDLDEDVSGENIVAGRGAGEGRKSFERWLAGRASHSSVVIHG